METKGRPAVLEVVDLRVYFHTRHGLGKAVDGVTFELREGEVLGLVGESGSGKSITALSILGLHPRPAARIEGGEILYMGEDLLKKNDGEMRKYRGGRIAMILQDPMTALNPVFTVGNQVAESLRLHTRLIGDEIKKRSVELLELLRIPAAEEHIGSYPHELSGGMRQRVVGAISLAGDPEVLIADEPTSSLDVTIQASFLSLLKEIQARRSLAVLFITHDFSVVRRICDRVVVMYGGRTLEAASVEEIFENPLHPYTRGLIESVPSLDLRSRRLTSVPGNPPSIYDTLKGCRFHPRCRAREEHGLSVCSEEEPEQIEVSPEHSVRCWIYADLVQTKH